MGRGSRKNQQGGEGRYSAQKPTARCNNSQRALYSPVLLANAQKTNLKKKLIYFKTTGSHAHKRMPELLAEVLKNIEVWASLPEKTAWYGGQDPAFLKSSLGNVDVPFCLSL